MSHRPVLVDSADESAVGYVYFIEGADSGLIKIGFSRNPRRRLGAIRAHAAEPVRLLATVRGGPDLARDVHSRFRRRRVQGAWFHPNEEMLALIRSADQWELAPEGSAGPRTDLRDHAFGARLRALRLAGGWSISQLATRTGLSRQTIYALEAGRGEGAVETVILAAETLGVGLDALSPVLAARLLAVLPAPARRMPTSA
jgi:DNA-binding XRE family transcriptional regulator